MCHTRAEVKSSNKRAERSTVHAHLARSVFGELDLDRDRDLVLDLVLARCNATTLLGFIDCHTKAMYTQAVLVSGLPMQDRRSKFARTWSASTFQNLVPLSSKFRSTRRLSESSTRSSNRHAASRKSIFRATGAGAGIPVKLWTNIGGMKAGKSVW